MAVDYSIRVAGQDEIEQALFGIAARGADLHPLMERFGTVLETSTMERFEHEKAPDGTKWTPTFRSEHEGGKILTDTARLKLSLRPTAGRDQVVIGTNVVYARRHQEGFDGTETVGSHRRTMRSIFGRQLKAPIEVVVPSFERHAHTPKREFLGLSTDDREELLAQAEDYVAELAPEIER